MSGEEFRVNNVVSLAVSDARRYRKIENKLQKFCLNSMEQGLDVIPIAYIAALFEWSDREVLKDE
jgi:hypothetical protein